MAFNPISLDSKLKTPGASEIDEQQVTKNIAIALHWSEGDFDIYVRFGDYRNPFQSIAATCWSSSEAIRMYNDFGAMLASMNPN